MRFYIVAIFWLILDQVTKILILNKFSNKSPGYSEDIIGDFFCLTYVHNEGGAFGIKLIMSPWAVLISTIFVFILLTYYTLKKEESSLFKYGLALILGGAAGNLIDRFRFGYVIDFLDFKVWPVFNIADIAITVGVGLVICHLLFYPSETIQNKEQSEEIEAKKIEEEAIEPAENANTVEEIETNNIKS